MQLPSGMIAVSTLLGLLLMFLGYSEAQFNVVRNTKYGKVMGTALPTVERYLGIPYAAPPVAQLRWRPPELHPGWIDTGEVRNATKLGAYCPQVAFNSSEATVIGEEDCLFLNIYVPRLPSSDYYAVMVFFHGEGFFSGKSDLFDGSLLAVTGSIIVVTFNYRLGSLGFFSTGDNQATGNYGLLDQRAALQWVHENIQYFGGDADRVTIFGSSAGAVSVLLHAMTPLNHGSPQLFHRVIAQSGSPFGWKDFQSNPRYNAMKLMKDENCPTFSTALGLECLRESSADEIVRLQGSRDQWMEDCVGSPWVPSMDGTFLTDVPDIMASSEEIISEMKGRFGFILGVNDFDSTVGYNQVKTIQDENDFKRFLREVLKSYFEDNDKMADVVAYNYVDATDPPSSAMGWQRLALNATRDLFIAAPSLNMSRLTSSDDGFSSPTYYYFFVQKPSDALIEAGVAYPNVDITDGARHLEELSYVFGIPLTLANVSEEDRNISLRIMTYWTNFAKTGNPSMGNEVVTEWPNYSWESQMYLQFGTKVAGHNVTRMRDHLISDEVVFWTQELEMYEEGKGLDDSIALPRSNETTPSEPVQPIVTTTKGQVRGLRIAKQDYVLDRFFRIPFAKPPVGLLRFKHPEPHPGWDGILDASGNSSSVEWFNGCATFAFVGNASVGKEDCLHLNVYVPGGINATRTTSLPVLVWLYGGAYVWGTSVGLRHYYDMERIATQGKVIGVSINYRLGPLGFLSTMDDHAPGNAGFLDQVAGLQWVQANIAAFGGDPAKVTIFGESAGAGSVSLHMVSPLSKDLFLRGIQESGSIPAHWTTVFHPLDQAKRLATMVGCPVDSAKLLVRCLQNKPVGQITRGGMFNDLNGPKDNAWAAVVDGYFLIDNPFNLLNASADKDLLIGHNSMDGHLFASIDFLAINIANVPMSRDDVVRSSTLFAPAVPDHVAEAVAFKYINWEEPETSLVWPKIAVVDMYSDHMFVVPSYWCANERLSAGGSGRTFMYRFSEKTRLTWLPEWMEADHTAEMKYVFGHPFGQRNFTDADRKLSLALMTHWTNFAWTGNPNYPNQGDIYAEWPEYKLDTKFAFEFSTSTAMQPEKYPRVISNYRGEIVEFWTSLLKDLWTLPLDVCPVTWADKASTKWLSSPRKRGGRAVTCVEEPLVKATDSGCVRGYEVESNGKVIERYLGIPYAKPPLATLRFAQPQPADSWSDVYSATNYSRICPQGSALDESMSEDCLYLCIYVPRTNLSEDNADGLPVMVWLHGGGYVYGNGMEKLKGDTLAALGDVIVVNFNYRLGSFGFMTTDDEYSPGNYGLLDQQLALSWIKDNIESFGGDPGKITIFGNSAGAQSVLLQSLSPTNADLGISRAIVESSPLFPIDDMRQLDRAVSLAEAASCPTNTGNEAMVNCLRNLDASALLTAQSATGLRFEPTVDGEFIPAHPRDMAVPSEVRKWTFIIGVNSGEGSVRWGDVQNVGNEKQYHHIVDLYMEPSYGWRASLVDQQYADYDDLNFFNIDVKMQTHLTQLFGDERFVIPALEIAEEYTDYGAKTYFYYFTYPHNRPDLYGFPSWAGAAHSAEFSFVWGDVINDDAQTEEVKELSRRMIDYWANFAKTGDPNSDYGAEPAAEVEWETYKGGRPSSVAKNYIQFDLGNKTQAKRDLRPTQKAFWLEHMASEAKYCETDAPTLGPTNPPPPSHLENPVASTSAGPVRGKRVNDLFDVNVFLGIPYAKPPVGALRFAGAQQADEWTAVLDATVPKPPCVQVARDGDLIGDEDCLFLDVFMPTGLINAKSSSMPVVLWIHGDSSGEGASYLSGSFWSGGGSPGWDASAATLDPSFLAYLGNAVVVRPNFRLGPLGFLTTQTDTMAGNYGLSDLRQALIWAKENAKNFAADPSKITVIGQGSGAAAAELLGVLPSTRDHVTRVISMSGSAFAPWAFCLDSECKKVAQAAASATSCTESDILTCLRDSPVEDIVTAIPLLHVTPEQDDTSNVWGTWRFTADGDIVPKDVALEELFASSSADFLTGTMSHGFYDYLKAAETNAGSSADLLRDAIEDTNQFLAHSNVEHWPSEIRKTLEHSYTNWKDRSDPNLVFESTVKYYTDLFFAVGSSKGVESKLAAGIGSLYQMVVAEPLIRDGESSLPSWVGGRHGDDVIYTFGLPFTDASSYSDSDRAFSMAVMGYWINFAWHGDPNNVFSPQKWTRFTAENKAYLKMSSKPRPPRTPANFNDEKYNLWTSVVPMFEPVITEKTTAAPQPTVRSSSLQLPRETTKPQSDPCIEEIPPIGEGLGLDLTPEEASSAIYAMFSVCLVLGFVLIIFSTAWGCQSRVITTKNAKTRKENFSFANGTFEKGAAHDGKVSAL